MKSTTEVSVEKVAVKDTPEQGELSASQLAEWIRQNFFSEFSDSEFGQQLEKAKEIYVRVKTYLETHELSLSLDTLNAVKELIMNDAPPSKQLQEQHGKPVGGTAQSPTKAVEPKQPATLDSLEEQLGSIEKKAFWALILLIIILFIK